MRLLVYTLLFLVFNIQGFTQERPFITIGAMVGQQQHRSEVNYGPPSSQGKFEESNVMFGVKSKFNLQLYSNLYSNIGIGILQYKSNIRRVYNRRFWDDYTAIINYTYNTRYNLLNLPYGIDYAFIKNQKFSMLVGSALDLNFSFSQRYAQRGRSDRIFRMYFFGLSNQVSIAFRKHTSNGKFLELRPFLTTFETWRKDEILFENQNEFHQTNFSAFGLNFSYGFRL